MRRFSDVFRPIRDINQVATIVAEKPYEKVSSRFSFIPTLEPIRVLQSLGWQPVAVAEQRVRDKGKAGFQRHAVKFQHPDYAGELGLHETRPELVMVNDHSASTAFQFIIGLWEKVCSNGLIVCRENIADERVLHRGYTAEKVAHAIANLIPNIPKILSDVERFRHIQLTEPEAEAFGRAAIELRWDGEKYSVNPRAIVQPLRTSQQENSIYNILNRTQESVIKGGVYVKNKETGYSQRARAVGSLSENLRLNKALWILADEFAKLKSN